MTRRELLAALALIPFVRMPSHHATRPESWSVVYFGRGLTSEIHGRERVVKEWEYVTGDGRSCL